MKHETILVVDDSATMRNIIRKILEPEGYNVIEATNGIEALTRALSANAPDLITLDIDMPKMDGFGACQRILSDYHQHGIALKQKKRPHIVFITANDNVENRRRGFEAGATDFLAKPFSDADILATIKRILSPSNHMPEMTALVVDDSSLARNIIVENVTRDGLTVIEAENGREALSIVQDDKEGIDIIITDLMMPEIDGITLCNTIRNDLQLDAIPVIFLTSMADQQQLLKVFQAGATDYLVKPFFQEELMARIRIHLEKSRLIRELRNRIAEHEVAEKEREERQKLQGVVEMAGAVCHELNQPIQTVSGLAELMILKADADNPMVTYAQKVKEQVDRMGTITGKLARVTAYRTKPHDAGTTIFDIDGSAGDPPGGG
jgi:two-component system cell cycle response regulator